MVKSMTGFGRALTESEQWNITTEIKSVNNRYLDVVVKMPRIYNQFEDFVKKQISAVLSRGHVEVYITVEELGEGKQTVTVDTDLVKSYCSAMEEIAATANTQWNPDLSFIASQHGVLTVQKEEADSEAFQKQLADTLVLSLNQLTEMRVVEGERLAKDILNRLNMLRDIRDGIASRAPLVVSDYREKLTLRIKEFLDGVELDEAKLLNEVAFFADKADITEEVTRLLSHFQQFEENIRNDAPCGRKLDFILQEMNREVNTIGSKANDGDITSMVIDAKGILEKIREQVQNFE